MMFWPAAGAAGLAVAAWFVTRQRRAAAYVDHTVTEARRAHDVAVAAETMQYVPLDWVDAGRIYQIDSRSFICPPPGEAMVLVGSRAEAEFAVSLLGLNEHRVTIAEYPWRLHDLVAGTRIVILPSASELPQVEGIVANLRSVGGRYVRLVV